MLIHYNFSDNFIPYSCTNGCEIWSTFRNSEEITVSCEMGSTQLVTYIVDNGLTDDFQSAYNLCGHSTETALFRVYNDIVVTIGKGNGNFLVLLDLSSAFDTIDHSNLFTVLGKHVGICDDHHDALNLIVSYLSDRKQQVRIDNIMSDLALAY